MGQFSVRSLLRSRQHRVIIAFYLGIGVAFNLLFLSTPVVQKQMAAGGAAWRRCYPSVASHHHSNDVVLRRRHSSGFRHATGFEGQLDISHYPGERRRKLYIGKASSHACYWRAARLGCAGRIAIFDLAVRPAAAHVTILFLLGATVAEICLQGFQKIPFTCSYLPGKTGIHMIVAFTMLVFLQFLNFCAGLELNAMQRASSCFITIAIFAVVLYVLRRWTADQTSSDDLGIQFEDEGSPAIQGLGLTI